MTKNEIFVKCNEASEDFIMWQKPRKLTPNADHISEFIDTYAGVNLPYGYELHEKRSSGLYKRYMEFCWEMNFLIVDRTTFYERLGRHFKIVRDYYKRGKARKKPKNTLYSTGISEAERKGIGLFINEFLEVGEDTQGKPYEVRTAEVYARYWDWCEKRNFFRTSYRVFNVVLRESIALKVLRKRPRGGGNPTTMLVGARIRGDGKEGA